MTDCTLVLPHFDDEYCGLRSIVESKDWNVINAVFVTDSTTQFEPAEIPSIYYDRRLQESEQYLNLHQNMLTIRVLDFPEQLWDNRIITENLRKVLKQIHFEDIVFVPYFNDAHLDHKVVGRMFLRKEVAEYSDIIYYRVHHVNPDGHVPAASSDDMRLALEFEDQRTYGKNWDPGEFIELYPSQRKQIPYLQCEEYRHKNIVAFTGARYTAYANPSSTT